MSDASPRNSGVEVTIRPETLMEELGIKKSVYYEDIKFLGLELEKDDNSKVFLKEDQANQVRALRSHVKITGKRNGFEVQSGGELATTEEGAIASETHPPEQEDPCAGFNEEALFLEAAELAGHRMTLGEQVVLSLANQMTYEDLPDSVKQKVDGVRNAAVPKFQPEAIASQLLSKWRSQRSENPQPEAVEAAA